MCIAHCSGFLPVESLCGAGGDRHRTQEQYKHILEIMIKVMKEMNGVLLRRVTGLWL